ncbi:primosomal replication protein N [Nitrosomonas sp. Nm166]|uniref:primosomal replication protein N n=1 Tax=Nitrosomonas sp. Nm166 TaxID=1881054 RepID=UPI0008F24E6A|nr:primosomal replication protein N [Nitrosomonas sp. Nm166]SFE78955.1 restart primosome assembly protein PriB [Nitrosomonas sp. Nm166]
MDCNQTIICGKIIKRCALRYTPAGIAVIEFTVNHVSQQIEAGVARQIMCEISTVALGQLALTVAELKINSKIKLIGFLNRKSHLSQQLVLHANDVILI